jgi:hypothetical protein
VNNFHNAMECYAICTYLKSFGYKAQVDRNTLVTYVQDLKYVDPVFSSLDSFVVLPIPTWEAAREFIKVRSQS